MIIYKITNKMNGRVYIGQTIRPLEERIKEHKRQKGCIMYKAFKKHGFENFTIEIIDRADTIEELNEKEIYWINHYDSFVNGYNCCKGGGNTFGYRHTEESKKKMSENQVKKFKEDNHFFGKHHTEESKELMSKAKKGKPNHKSLGVRNLDTGEEFETIVAACQKYPHIKETHISRVCRGKRKTTGGFRWEYLS